MTMLAGERLAHEYSPPPAGTLVQPTVRGAPRASAATSLKKIEGQIRELQTMIEDDRSCQDVVTQVASAARPLRWLAASAIASGL